MPAAVVFACSLPANVAVELSRLLVAVVERRIETETAIFAVVDLPRVAGRSLRVLQQTRAHFPKCRCARLAGAGAIFAHTVGKLSGAALTRPAAALLVVFVHLRHREIR